MVSDVAALEVLAACLASPQELADARMILEPEDFFHEGHRTVFRAMCDMADAERPLGPQTLVGYLAELGNPRELGERPDMAVIDLVTRAWTPKAMEEYARQLKGARARREMRTLGQRLQQASDEIEDLDKLTDFAASRWVELGQMVDNPLGSRVVRGLVEDFDEWLRTPEDPANWVVPGLLDRMDAMMFLGGEGSGKSWLLRQFALCIMAGVHPFTLRHITAQRVLHIDAENAESMIRRHLRSLTPVVARHGEWDTDRIRLLCRPEGFDLRKTKDRQEIERVIAEHRPAVITAGPLYKMAQRGSSDWDTAAASVREVLDDWRGKYGCAYVLEHHMPKGDGKDRPPTPFGGSEWLRWCTHGRILNALENGYYELTPFRGDREPRDLPLAIRRGGVLPWTPVNDPEEIEFQRPKAKK